MSIKTSLLVLLKTDVCSWFNKPSQSIFGNWVAFLSKSFIVGAILQNKRLFGRRTRLQEASSWPSIHGMYKGNATVHISQHCDRTWASVGSWEEVFAFFLVPFFFFNYYLLSHSPNKLPCNVHNFKMTPRFCKSEKGRSPEVWNSFTLLSFIGSCCSLVSACPAGVSETNWNSDLES